MKMSIYESMFKDVVQCLSEHGFKRVGYKRVTGSYPVSIKSSKNDASVMVLVNEIILYNNGVTEDEFKGIMHHEIYHAISPSTNLETIRSLSLCCLLLTAPLLWSGFHGLSLFLGAIGVIGIINFSKMMREEEFKADLFALETAGDTFISALRKVAGDGGGGLFSTHPSLEERLRRLGYQ